MSRATCCDLHATLCTLASGPLGGGGDGALCTYLPGPSTLLPLIDPVNFPSRGWSIMDPSLFSPPIVHSQLGLLSSHITSFDHPQLYYLRISLAF